MKETMSDANDAVNKQTANAAKKINDAVGPDKDSALKYGVNAPNNPLKSPVSLGGGGAGEGLGGLLPDARRPPSIPASGQKGKSFGNKDFWVVKMGDKDKPKKAKASIEAMPNPAHDYTNVIIGYDYLSGTAMVVDIAGHTLDTFKNHRADGAGGYEPIS